MQARAWVSTNPIWAGWTFRCRICSAAAHFSTSARSTGTSRRCRTTAPGPDSRKTGRSDYRLEDTNVELRPGVPDLFAGLRAGPDRVLPGCQRRPGTLVAIHFDASSSSARRSRPASTTRRISGAAAALWSTTGGPASDPTSGGRYSAQYVRYLDRDLGSSSFLRLDLDAAQYIPLFNRTRVIALHGASSLTTAGNSQHVPFYLQPTLGGPDTLRGYRFTASTATTRSW